MTANQQRLLDFIRDQITATGVAPTYARMAKHMSTASRGSVHSLVGRIVEDGHLVRLQGRNNGLRLPIGVNLASVSTDRLRAEIARREASDD
jgi:SOS-response transcriptional repressor LexA